jgi:hypothetical protein
MLKILRHVKDAFSLKEIPVGKIQGLLSSSFSCFANCYCQRALVRESGMILTQMGRTIYQ